MAFPSWSNRPYHYHHLGIPKWSVFCLPLLHCLWTDYNITCNAHLYQFPVPFAVVSSQNWVFAGAGELIPKQTGDPVLLLWFVIFLCSDSVNNITTTLSSMTCVSFHHCLIIPYDQSTSSRQSPMCCALDSLSLRVYSTYTRIYWIASDYHLRADYTADDAVLSVIHGYLFAVAVGSKQSRHLIWEGIKGSRCCCGDQPSQDDCFILT